jgi:broad specificity phosphatase PhoE
MSLKSIFLTRHSESVEDVDPTLHVMIGGQTVPLTEIGIAQANILGQTLSARFASDDQIAVYLSPTYRVQETWRVLSAHLPIPQSLTTDQRIRNLNWGNVTLENRSQIEAERYKVGVLSYQFPGGDNSPEYIRDVNYFLEEAIYGRRESLSPQYILVLTHGFALRVMIRSLLQLSDLDFKWLRNPPNGYCLEIAYSIQNDSFITTTPLLRVQQPTE